MMDNETRKELFEKAKYLGSEIEFSAGIIQNPIPISVEDLQHSLDNSMKLINQLVDYYKQVHNFVIRSMLITKTNDERK